MNAEQLAQAIYDHVLVRAILGLILANVLAGIAASLFTRSFRLAAVADFLLTRSVPYLLGAGTLQLVLLTVPPQWSGVTEPVSNGIWMFAIASLVGHILGTLRDIGLPVPPAIADKPKPETTATP